MSKAVNINSTLYNNGNMVQLASIIDDCALHWLFYCDIHKIKITPDLSKRQRLLYRKLFNYVVAYYIAVKLHARCKGSPLDSSDPVDVLYRIAGTSFYDFDESKMAYLIHFIKNTKKNAWHYIELRGFKNLLNVTSFGLDNRMFNNEDLFFSFNDLFKSINGSNFLNL